MAMTVIMTMPSVAMLLLVQESIVHLQKDLVQGKGLNSQNEVHVNLRVLCPPQLCRLVDAANFTLHIIQLCGRHKIYLVQQDSIRKCNLLYRLVYHPIRLHLLEPCDDMFGIYQGENAVQLHVCLSKVIRIESLSHGSRICQASGLNDDGVQRFSLAGCLLMQLFQASNEVSSHCAANAAIVHLDDVLLCDTSACVKQGIIDANLSKFILYHSNSLAVLALQDVVEECCLARA
mmetsp:Transcript_852/g.1667  ORF Transcript_852/g.1667 Transcript_852/m.1667 type:complete len:233 (-) Transcript_852:508-1206(-)